jgi:AraC-like DNA-binding protein
LQGAVRRGFDAENILQAAQIETSVYHDPNARIDGEQLQRLIIATRSVMNDEYMGFLDIQGKLEMGYIVGHSALGCDTLGHAVRKMANMVNAIRNDIEVDVQIDWASGGVDIAYHVSGLAEGVDPHLFHWFTSYWAYKFKCWLIGQRIPLSQVRFATARPTGAIDYSKVFRCPVVFDAEDNRISFGAAHMNARIIRTEVEFYDGAFLRDPSDWFAVSGGDQSVTSRVEQLLLDIYRKGLRTPTLDLLADRLCCSPRTLSRKLARENESFQRIKDRVRCDMAKKLLSESEASVADIAERLCFSEPSDFTRAFASWTGQTPSAYRVGVRS